LQNKTCKGLKRFCLCIAIFASCQNNANAEIDKSTQLLAEFDEIIPAFSDGLVVAEDSAQTPEMISGFNTFRTRYRASLSKPSNASRLARLDLLEALFRKRFDALLSHSNLPKNVKVQLVFTAESDFNSTPIDRKRIATRSSIGKEYLILVGDEFADQIDQALLSLSNALQNNALGQLTGYNSEPQLNKFPRMSLQQFARTAITFNPASIIQGPVPPMERVPRDKILYSVKNTRKIFQVEGISEELKDRIRLRLIPGMRNYTLLPDVEHAVDQYRQNDERFQVIHYRLLSDVITFLIAHELGHVFQDTKELSPSTSALSLEVEADKLAVNMIDGLHDTNPRSIVIALAAFQRYKSVQKMFDDSHPLDLDRLRLAFNDLSSTDSALLNDVNCAFNLLKISCPVTDTRNSELNKVTECHYVKSLDQRLRMTIKCDWIEKKLEPDDQFQINLKLRAYNPVEPKQEFGIFELRWVRELADWTYNGSTAVKTGEHDLSLALPYELASTYPDCGVEIVSISLTRPKSEGQSREWIVHWANKQPPAVSGLQPLTCLFLARNAFENKSREISLNLYKKAMGEMSCFTIPDFFALSSCMWHEGGTAREARHILSSGSERYQQFDRFHYALGLASEAHGDLQTALDEYFLEAQGKKFSPLHGRAIEKANKLLSSSDSKMQQLNVATDRVDEFEPEKSKMRKDELALKNLEQSLEVLEDGGSKLVAPYYWCKLQKLIGADHQPNYKRKLKFLSTEFPCFSDFSLDLIEIKLYEKKRKEAKSLFLELLKRDLWNPRISDVAQTLKTGGS